MPILVMLLVHPRLAHRVVGAFSSQAPYWPRAHNASALWRYLFDVGATSDGRTRAISAVSCQECAVLYRHRLAGGQR